MSNLDIIYDVIIAFIWDELNTNKEVISQPTSLPSFVTFDGFYFCLWPKNLSFERCGSKSPSFFFWRSRCSYRGRSVQGPNFEEKQD